MTSIFMGKKIVIVSCVFPPEPLVSATISESIAESLSINNEVVVLCPRPSRPIGNVPSYNYSKKPYKVHILNSYICPESKIFGRFRESYSFGKAVSNYLKKNHETIRCVYANTFPTISQYLIVTICNKYAIPCILHIQDIYPESLTSKLGKVGKFLNGFLVKLDKHYISKADAIIAISKSMKEHLTTSRNLDRDSIHVIYNWQDERLFEQNSCKQIDKEFFTFMFAGSISPSADLPNVIQAFANANIPKSRLAIVGDGTDKQKCIKLASNFPDKSIEFESAFGPEIIEKQKDANILILSLKKGISKTALPSKLPAYLFSAKPIIATSELNTDISSIINESQSGIVIQPEDISALSSAMIQFYNLSENKRLEMGRCGRNYGLKNFTKEINCETICSIIRNLMRE